ncbi:antibiotic biosynthesis monooxygenase family protein [Neorhizobium petrolearium]|uniref:Antibiotic biosynthesis monooxygenase n=1 Tax=Neorhizobium petrolearium TaxID=515361 RepID=A0ABY8M8H1_9HYPH|nr:antibiotic biosynthesis monooxygenase family protein [Neorhizobium petrolearium]MCC2610611.1 antibiotic biosynthesis monooxygenase [Neorhizobium petrolearium]WGI70747.1 antibiotic biosynthesis monooxygenase [Neorhizobium petrolearium]
MSEMKSGRVVRVNRFSVPAGARDEFMRLIGRTHDIIRAQPGFIDDMVLEQNSGADTFNLITILQFEGEHVLQPVIAAVAKADAAAGIDRQMLSRRLGVETHVAFYSPVMLPELLPA